MKKSISVLLVCFFAVTILLTGLYWYADSETETLNAQSRAALGGQYVTLDGGVVHYELEGDARAKAVVLVHGFSIPFYIWDQTFQYLRDQGFRVLRFDLFGRGYSDRPDADYSIGLYVKQLHGLLSELNITEPVRLIGLSMGGAIVTHYTNLYPEQVEKVSLIDPLIETPVSLELRVILIPGLGEYLAKVVLIPRLRKSSKKAVYDANTFPDWQEKFSPQTRYAGYSRALLKTARHLAGKGFQDEYEKLGRSGIPVQLFWGTEDLTIPFGDNMKVKDAIPHVEFHAVEKAGHLPHYERPQIVNPLLGKFLSK